jgi:hypothetical protein
VANFRQHRSTSLEQRGNIGTYPRHPRLPCPLLETAVDQAIAACGADAREAVRALIVANNFLKARVTRLQASVSTG